jgi:hypothetical protein
VPLPLLLEILAPAGVVVLCSFHAAQYVVSTASLPGGVLLTDTINLTVYGEHQGWF